VACLYALVSPGGSPGVTTAALALAFGWPGSVIVAECDPSGGSILAGTMAGHLPGGPGLVEHAIEESGIEWTFLRPSGFAANTLMWAHQIRSGNVVRWPFGAARRALIDERDIASVAVRALTEDGHAGARYVLSGPEVLTQAGQLAAIGDAIGRDLTWEELPKDAALEALTAAWGDRAFAETAVDAWEWFVDHPETVSPEVRAITGAPARSFADWAADNAAEFS